jgi:Domain of unknown function (DUF6438)
MLRNSIFFVLVFFFGCHSSKQINSSPQLLFSIEKGPCFGACPEYKLEVFTNGEAHLKGIRNVAQVGEFKTHVSDSLLSEMKKSIGAMDIASLDTNYVNKYLTDFPAIDLYFDLKSERKHIHIFHQQPPQEISDLLRLLEGFENAIDWKNTN